MFSGEWLLSAKATAATLRTRPVAHWFSGYWYSDQKCQRRLNIGNILLPFFVWINIIVSVVRWFYCYWPDSLSRALMSWWCTKLLLFQAYSTGARQGHRLAKTLTTWRFHQQNLPSIMNINWKYMYYVWTATNAGFKSFTVESALAKGFVVAICVTIRIKWDRLWKAATSRCRTVRNQEQIVHSGVN